MKTIYRLDYTSVVVYHNTDILHKLVTISVFLLHYACQGFASTADRKYIMFHDLNVVIDGLFFID